MNLSNLNQYDFDVLVEKAKKYDEQKYIYEKNFDKVNNITEEEYEKYSSLCVCMTWIANELSEK